VIVFKVRNEPATFQQYHTRADGIDWVLTLSGGLRRVVNKGQRLLLGEEQTYNHREPANLFPLPLAERWIYPLTLTMAIKKKTKHQEYILFRDDPKTS